MKGEIKMILGKKSFNRDDILMTGHLRVKVLTEPEQKYSKWYFRILQFLTLNKRFRKRWHYECKIINDYYGEMVQNTGRRSC